MSRAAPVVVFCYARPDHLRRMVESLRANPESAETEVWFFCDGAKRVEDETQVRAVREFIAAVDGFGAVHRVWRERNFGLAASIIDGVTRVLAERGRAIVVEDDLLLSPHFLRFMNQGLDRYADEPRVASIHGFSYPTDDTLPQTFFQRGADCWGWATWARAWRHFEPDGQVLLARLRERRLTRQFDLDGSFPYTRMLEEQVAGRNNSWAIRWHAACFLEGLLTLYPGRTLVENIGNDSSGTHCRSSDTYSGATSNEIVEMFPIPIEESSSARDSFKRFHRRSQGLRQRLRGALADALARGR